MILFTKGTKLYSPEYFNPQIGTFNIFPENAVKDDSGTIVSVPLTFTLLQNHQSGNKTTRTGSVNLTKQQFDYLQIDVYGNIGNIGACIQILLAFNIIDIDNAVILNFDSNGGSDNMQFMVIEKNTSQQLSSNIFTKEGFTFSGWSTTSNGNVEYNDNTSIPVTENDITLFAIWTATTS